MGAKKSILAEAMLKKVRDSAFLQGKASIFQAINKAHNTKLRKQTKSQARPHTVLHSKQHDVDIRANVDSDKNYFLNEFLKLMAFAESYFRKR